MTVPRATVEWAAGDYDLAATLDSGQAFRWRLESGGWEGVLGRRWVRLRRVEGRLTAECTGAPGDWRWLRDYLSMDHPIDLMVATFPREPLIEAAVAKFRGLRLLRQEPWECLASFLMSSTKQIGHIRQIIEALCDRWGEEVEGESGWLPGRARRTFPAAGTLAALSEAKLRECRMGFRAAYLKAAARAVADGALDLGRLRTLETGEARERLMALAGVGRKIADCVLLFAYGRLEVFPVDVWVMRALEELHSGEGRSSRAGLMRLSETHFGPYGGYAQQYLFHYVRWRAGKVVAPGPEGLPD